MPRTKGAVLQAQSPKKRCQSAPPPAPFGGSIHGRRDGEGHPRMNGRTVQMTVSTYVGEEELRELLIGFDRRGRKAR